MNRSKPDLVGHPVRSPEWLVDARDRLVSSLSRRWPVEKAEDAAQHAVEKVLPERFDLRLMPWGEGTEVPTSGNNLVIVGTDNIGLLHIRILGATGKRIKDTDETQLPDQAAAISTLKQRVAGLLPARVLTDAEKAQVIAEAASIVGQALPKDVGLEFKEDPFEYMRAIALNHLRTRSRRLLPAELTEPPAVDSSARDAELLVVWEAVTSLPDAMRRAIELYYFEIPEKTGKRKGTDKAVGGAMHDERRLPGKPDGDHGRRAWELRTRAEARLRGRLADRVSGYGFSDPGARVPKASSKKTARDS